jgi:hypothetical protein
MEMEAPYSDVMLSSWAGMKEENDGAGAWSSHAKGIL